MSTLNPSTVLWMALPWASRTVCEHSGLGVIVRNHVIKFTAGFQCNIPNVHAGKSYLYSGVRRSHDVAFVLQYEQIKVIMLGESRQKMVHTIVIPIYKILEFHRYRHVKIVCVVYHTSCFIKNVSPWKPEILCVGAHF